MYCMMSCKKNGGELAGGAAGRAQRMSGDQLAGGEQLLCAPLILYIHMYMYMYIIHTHKIVITSIFLSFLFLSCLSK